MRSLTLLSSLACLHAALSNADADEGNGTTTRAVDSSLPNHPAAPLVCLLPLNAFIVPCRPSLISIFIVSAPPVVFIASSLPLSPPASDEHQNF